MTKPIDANDTHWIGVGANPARQRAHNERLVLSLVKAQNGISSSEIAQQTGLSAQTASVLTRALEQDGYLMRGQPKKGKVGKPRSPLHLNPMGACAYGLRIGRRGADLVLVDFEGTEIGSVARAYKYPTPDFIDQFVEDGIAALGQKAEPRRPDQVIGIGVASPFELWNWLDVEKAPRSEMEAWRAHSFAQNFARFTKLPVLLANDATVACGAELSFGVGANLTNFVYFYVGAFVGGGVVVDNKVVPGPNGNAGALGSLPIGRITDPDHQLIHHASLHVLEQRLEAAGAGSIILREQPEMWEAYPAIVNDWLDETAHALAKAAVTVTAVLDVPDIVIDGGFPTPILKRLIEETQTAMLKVDRRGIRTPALTAGVLGRRGAALGAAYMPIAAEFLV